jgi:hypothetical protein
MRLAAPVFCFVGSYENSFCHIFHKHGKAKTLARGFALEHRRWRGGAIPRPLVLRHSMGVEARSQKQGMLAVLGFDSVNALVQPRHLLNLKRRAKAIKLVIVAFSEVQENNTRRAVLLAWAGEREPPPPGCWSCLTTCGRLAGPRES